MMADRVLRDELLRSERYWSVGIEAQRLFVHLLLCADGYGRFSGKNFTVRSGCLPGQSVDPATVEKMLSDLNDADLIRLYEVQNERYIFIPRFNQRLRYKNPSKYPEPPKEINDLIIKMSDTSQTRVRLVSDTCRPKRSEVKRSEVNPLAQTSFARFWFAYPRKQSKGRAEKAWLALSPNEQLIAEILQAIERAKTSDQWRKDAGKFIPHPASWLRARGWEDELPSVEPEYRMGKFVI